MNMRRKTIILLLAGFCFLPVGAQTAKEQQSDYDSFKKQALKEYSDYRKECLKEYADFVRRAWKDYGAEKAVPKPKDEEFVPVVAKLDNETESWLSTQLEWVRDKAKRLFQKKKKSNKRKPESKPVEIEQVIRIKQENQEQPRPLSPVIEAPVERPSHLVFMLYGTECKVRVDEDCKFKLGGTSNQEIATTLEGMVTGSYDNLLSDCLKLRLTHKLSDWAYYQMLKALTDTYLGKDTNESVLLQAFLYSQSGYKMRLGKNMGKLYLLAASKHFIYDLNYFSIDGEWYYVLNDEKVTRMTICEAKYPNELPMSLLIPNAQDFAVAQSPERTITSLRYPDFSFTVSSNKNLMEFYNSYPTSVVNNNIMTRWAMYANTPIDRGIGGQLYPAMKEKLTGLSELDAVERILNWVQTGFVYNYDNNVWGGDRAFFAEESLFYPYCDCEDRAILMSHLVRDLLGLDVILVYYPGHLAMAVGFTDEVVGDYIMLEGKRYTVCDPTFIGAGVGRTMDDMDNGKATVIKLEKTL